MQHKTGITCRMPSTKYNSRDNAARFYIGYSQYTNIIHHQQQTPDSPSVITFPAEKTLRMPVNWSVIAQNVPPESCNCPTRIPWNHQDPLYIHRILFARTPWYRILYTLDILGLHIKRYRTQYTEFEGKTSARLWSHWRRVSRELSGENRPRYIGSAL